MQNLYLTERTFQLEVCTMNIDPLSKTQAVVCLNSQFQFIQLEIAKKIKQCKQL